jgi:hypothetical protein
MSITGFTSIAMIFQRFEDALIHVYAHEIKRLITLFDLGWKIVEI